MSENKKGPGSSLANSQGTNKNSYKLYHERNEESKMNVSTAISVLKNNIERYDEQMKMHGIMGGDLLDENPTISAMRKAVEILENIKIVYQKTVIPNELYRDGDIEYVKKGSAIGMADELINYIEFKDRHIFELDQKEIVGKLMIADMRKGAKMSDKTGKMILIKDGVNIDIFDDKNMSDRVLMFDYPEGTNMEQLHEFYKLIGKECEIVEAVHPKRLYTLTEEQYPVLMLVDEEYLYHKTAQVNPIASYLYGTDVHGHPINGNVLIIGTKEGLDGMEFCGMNEEQAVELRERLITIRQHLE